MNKIDLSVKSFNSLFRDPQGAKVQRAWIPEYKGLGIDVGKTKKSLIYKFKSPISGKFRIITLDSYSNTQIVTDNELEDVVDDYYQIRRKTRNGVDPLADKEPPMSTYLSPVKLNFRRQKW